MGWCSATEIMDAAVRAADEVARAVGADVQTEIDQDWLDVILRPFVVIIADKLRDGDWDCIEESDYFPRFRQEMLGYDNRDMAGWYREQLGYATNPDQVREYSEALATLLEASTDGR